MTRRRVLDYDSLAFVDFSSTRPVSLKEAYAADDILMWQGMIERQIEDMADKAEETGNLEYSTLLKKFLNTWKTNEITGALSIETITILKNAADWASAFPWTFKKYFSVLRDNLKRLIAKQEELPTIPKEEPKKEKPAHGGTHKPTNELDTEKRPEASDFGPETTPEEATPPAEERTKNPEEIAQDIQSAVGAAARP